MLGANTQGATLAEVRENLKEAVQLVLDANRELAERSLVSQSNVRGWDRRVREFCTVNGITYQGFSLLTANRDVLTNPEIVGIAERHHRTTAQIIFRFAIEVGMLPLTGTTSATHMRQDLEALDFQLASDDIERIDRIG